MLKQKPHCLCFRIHGAKRRITLSILSLLAAIGFSLLWSQTSGYTATLCAFDTISYGIGAIACIAYNISEARRWWREGCDKKNEEIHNEESPV